MAIKNRGQTRSLKHRIGFAALVLVLLGGIFAPVTQEVSAAVIIKNTPDGNQVNSKSLPTINNNWTISNPISGGTKEVATTNDATSSSKSTSSSKKTTKEATEFKTPRATQIAREVFGSTYWTLFDDGTLQIGETGKSTTYTGGSNDSAFNTSASVKVKDTATKIQFLGTITPSGNLGNLFAGFSKLTTVEGLANFKVGTPVTSLVGLFRNDPLLTKVDANTWDTSKVNDFSSMFKGDTALTYLDMSSWSSVSSSYNNNFAPNSKLTTLKMSDDWMNHGDSNGLSIFYNYTDGKGKLDLFYGDAEYNLDGFTQWSTNSAVASATSKNTAVWYLKLDPENSGSFKLHYAGGQVPNWPGYQGLNRDLITEIILDDTLKASKEARYLFSGFKNITKFTNGSFLDLSDATTIEHILIDDAKLAEIDVSAWDVSNVVDMGGAFQNTVIEKFDLSHWNVSKVTSFWDTFKGVQTEVLDFSGWETNNTGNNAPGGNGSENMISGATKLNRVIFGSGFNIKAKMPATTTANGDWVGVGTGNVNAPKGLDLTSTNNNHYTGNSKDEDTYVLSNYTYSNDFRFWEPSESADPSLNTGAYGSAGYTNDVLASDPWVDNYNESNLTDGSILHVLYKGIFGTSKWYIDEQHVLHISGGTFAKTWLDSVGVAYSPFGAYTGQITEIRPEGIVKLDALSKGLFYNLGSALTTVSGDVDKQHIFDTSAVTNMTSMFDRDSGLTSVNVGYFDTANVTDAGTVFQMNSNLVQLDLSNWNTSKVKSFYYIFSGMTKLNQIKFGANFSTVSATSVGVLPFLPNVTDGPPKLRWRQVTGTTRADASSMAASGPFFRPDVNSNPNIDTAGLANGTKYPVVADTYVLKAYTASYTVHTENESGTAIAGVNVQILDSNGKVVGYGTTDADGNVQINDIPIGEGYTIQQDPSQNINYYTHPDPITGVSVTANDQDNQDVLVLPMQRTSTDQLPITGANSTIAVLSILLVGLLSYLGYSMNKDRKFLKK